jgi:polysaccharide export outer membrane protein
MKKIICLFIGVIMLSACGVQYKQVPYFQDLEDTVMIEEEVVNYSALTIQKEDILAITVASLNTDASAIFNIGNTSSNINSTGSNVNPVLTANGFLVGQDGAIQLPLVGSINVLGMTTSAARALIQSKLTPFLKEPVVSLRLINLKVSILGDVARPGVYPVQNEKITINEALGMAGDLTITAVRSNVLLVREIDGKRQFIRINLHKKELFNSPHYYLKNNDVLYVQPSNAKYASVDSSYRNVSIILSALSVLALLITQF